MVKVLVALYQDSATARQVLEALLEAGFSGDDLSLVVRDKEAASLTVSAGSGAGFGALIGALVGIGTALVPGIGPLIAGSGLLAVALTAGVGAAAGALTGGLTAGLLDLRLSAAETTRCAETLRQGGAIVSVTTKEQWLEWAQRIMARRQPLSLEEREAHWYDSSWGAFGSSSALVLPASGKTTPEPGGAAAASQSLRQQRRPYKYNN